MERHRRREQETATLAREKAQDEVLRTRQREAEAQLLKKERELEQAYDQQSLKLRSDIDAAAQKHELASLRADFAQKQSALEARLKEDLDCRCLQLEAEKAQHSNWLIKNENEMVERFQKFERELELRREREFRKPGEQP